MTESSKQQASIPQPGSEQRDENLVNPSEDLVYKRAHNQNARELIENPAVTPEMPNETLDIRSDLLRDENE